MAYEIIPDYEIKIGAADILEDQYLYQLKAILSPHGAIIDYEKDVAALDLGVHLYKPGESSEKHLGSQRVWMQCKGIQSASLTADSYAKASYIPVKGLSLDHVAYWYSAPEPVYLVAYVATVDQYYLEDVRVLVDEQIGAQRLREMTTEAQQTVTLRIAASSTIENALKKMVRHQSLRIDHPLFRGKALGHGLDPLRTTFHKPDATLFESIVHDLLNTYRFQKLAEQPVSPDVIDAGNGTITIVKGKLYSTYEWTSPIFTEYGYDEDTDFRIESQVFHAHGDVVVIIHSFVDEATTFSAKFDDLVEDWRNGGVEHVLVFFNESEMSKPRNMGAWRSKLSDLCPVPQGFDSLSYSILTSLPLYMQYFSRLNPYIVNLIEPMSHE
ncbi:hypothetical protein [Mycolicibacterium wolinskyi]|uniref:hypothetical protein n=1 Tax=Mycolicibacterium wolinskyi TaxID=59750 RepID=UPI00391780BE